MPLPFSLRITLLAAALLISAGTGSRLVAQTPVNDTPITTLTPIGATHLIARSYSGTVTQTSKTGVVTTGTFTLTTFKAGNLSATTVINGVTTTYDGTLPKVSFGAIQGTRAGYLFETIPVQTNLDGSISYASVFVPLVVDKGVARGGLQNVDGSALTFYAERDAKTVGGGH